MSYFTIGSPRKEDGTNKPPPTGRIQERSEGDAMHSTTSQNPSYWLPSWLSYTCTTRKDAESEWLAKENLETNPITINPKTRNHMADPFFWVLFNFCSLPGCLFPIQSVALSACVSSWTTHSWMLDKSPLLGPGSSPPSCNSMACPFAACCAVGRRRSKWPGGRCTSKFNGILAVSSDGKVPPQSRS